MSCLSFPRRGEEVNENIVQERERAGVDWELRRFTCSCSALPAQTQQKTHRIAVRVYHSRCPPPTSVISALRWHTVSRRGKHVYRATRFRFGITHMVIPQANCVPSHIYVV